MRNIQVKDAVIIARAFLADLLDAQPVQLLLEEVDLDEDERFWSVTFSYPVSYPENPIIRRVFKKVKVSTETGEAQGVKIRELEAWGDR